MCGYHCSTQTERLSAKIDHLLAAISLYFSTKTSLYNNLAILPRCTGKGKPPPSWPPGVSNTELRLIAMLLNQASRVDLLFLQEAAFAASSKPCTMQTALQVCLEGARVPLRTDRNNEVACKGSWPNELAGQRCPCHLILFLRKIFHNIFGIFVILFLYSKTKVCF